MHVSDVSQVDVVEDLVLIDSKGVGGVETKLLVEGSVDDVGTLQIGPGIAHKVVQAVVDQVLTQRVASHIGNHTNVAQVPDGIELAVVVQVHVQIENYGVPDIVQERKLLLHGLASRVVPVRQVAELEGGAGQEQLVGGAGVVRQAHAVVEPQLVPARRRQKRQAGQLVELGLEVNVPDHDDGSSVREVLDHRVLKKRAEQSVLAFYQLAVIRSGLVVQNLGVQDVVDERILIERQAQRFGDSSVLFD